MLNCCMCVLVVRDAMYFFLFVSYSMGQKLYFIFNFLSYLKCGQGVEIDNYFVQNMWPRGNKTFNNLLNIFQE